MLRKTLYTVMIVVIAFMFAACLDSPPSMVGLRAESSVEYSVGDVFHADDWIVYAVYSDGSEAEVPTGDVVFSIPDGTSIPARISFTVSYSGISALVTIDPTGPDGTVETFDVLTLPAVTSYKAGSAVSFEGLSFILTYTNGSVKVIGFDDPDIKLSISEGDTITEETEVLAVYSGNMRAVFSLHIIAEEPVAEERLMLLGYPGAIYTETEVSLRQFTYLWQKIDGTYEAVTKASMPDALSFIVSHNGIEISLSGDTYTPMEDGEYTFYPVLNGKAWRESYSAITFISGERPAYGGDVRISFVDNLGEAFELTANPSVKLDRRTLTVTVPGLPSDIQSEWFLDGSPLAMTREGDEFTSEDIAQGSHVVTGVFDNGTGDLGVGSLSVTIEVPAEIEIGPGA